MIDRRSFIQGAAAAAVAPVGALRAQAAGGDAQLAAMLQRHSEAYLRRSPEEASGAGFDTGANVALRSRLDDRSLAARAGDRAAVKAALRELSTIDRAALGARATLDRDVAQFVYTTLDDLLGRYGYVDGNLRPSPYVVSQMNGAYYWLPGAIGGRPIADGADVEAWLARLAALGTVIDQETARIRHDAAQGVVPPGFVIARTIAQIEALRDEPPLGSRLIAPALARIAERRLGDHAARAEALFRTRLAPALDRQIAVLRAVGVAAPDIAGVWRLPDGEAYYAAALRANTTADAGGGELHELGLAQCRELADELDRLLRAQGLTRGSVGERLAALDDDARFRVSDDDAGRGRLLALAEDRLNAVAARLPQAFGTIPTDPLVVRRMAVSMEAGSPGAFYGGGGAGGPGTIQLNLRHPAENATWRLPTLIHHEGLPGHHFQASVRDHSAALPLFRRLVRFSAYTEGWALYAEQVADELGVYADDPFGRIGYLQSQLFRAARIVVDTGLHHARWSRAQAIAWMVENAGEPPLATEREVDRYSVYPGQACSFKVGANRIVAAREAARAAMGARFDVRGFHDLVLKSGPVPMAVLEQSVAQWAAG